MSRTASPSSGPLSGSRRAVVSAMTALALAAPVVPVAVTFSASGAYAAVADDVDIHFSVAGETGVQARVGEVTTVEVGGVDSDVTVTYQWTRNHVAIPGAVAANYLVQAADFGKTLAVQVTVSSELDTATISKEVDEVLGAIQAPLPAPKVTGTATVGTTVSVTLPTLPKDATARVMWVGATSMMGGPIGRGTSFAIPASALGMTLSAFLTVDRPGYEELTVVTKVGVVKAKPATKKPVKRAAITVKAPRTVKSGKAFKVVLGKVEKSQVTVKASHLKKATTVKPSKASATVSIKAPKLTMKQKSRLVTVKVTMKPTTGATQTKTVKVKVVR